MPHTAHTWQSYQVSPWLEHVSHLVTLIQSSAAPAASYHNDTHVRSETKLSCQSYTAHGLAAYPHFHVSPQVAMPIVGLKYSIGTSAIGQNGEAFACLYCRVEYPKLDVPLSISPPKRIGWTEGADQLLNRYIFCTNNSH